MVYLTPEEALGVVPRQRGWVVEIGFGNGAFLKWLSTRFDLVLGLDIANLAFEKAKSRLSGTNAVVVKSDARFFLRYLVAPRSLSEVYILFPDPWPKNRKRRLIDADFARLLSSRLEAGGRVYVATDHEDYALQIEETLGSVMRKDDWRLPVATKYMLKWQRMGRGYRGFCFVNHRPVEMDFTPALRSISLRHEITARVGRVVRSEDALLKVDGLFERGKRRLYRLIYSEGGLSSRYFFLQEDGFLFSLNTWGEVFPPRMVELLKLL